MRSRILTIAMAVSLLAWSAACSKKPAENAQQDNTQQQPASSQPADNTASNPQPPAGNAATPAPSRKPRSSASHAAPAQPPTPQVITIPEGTVVSVRLGQTISTKSSNSGDQFTATLAEPLVVGDQTVADTGARATGTVVEAVPLGKFKGGAKLRLSLDSININGKRYPVQTSSVARAEKSKGKRSAVAIGGGAGLGALIGGIAGGGKGAAIGALVGGGAGTAGAAYTGNKDLVMPAETVLSFKLTQPVDVTQ
jgi:glucose/arabinose dehydrogenase